MASSALAAVVLAILLAAPVSPAAAAKRAAASATAAPDAATAEARRLFVLADEHYRLGRFADALIGYERAYEKKPLPGFLFNLAQCNRMMGNHPRAIFFFEGYLRGVPGAPNRTLVEELIAESRGAIAKAAAERRAADARHDAERLRLERDAAARVAGMGPTREGAHASRAGIHRKWWFWTLLGAAAVAGAAAGTVAALSGPELVLPSGTLGTADRR